MTSRGYRAFQDADDVPRSSIGLQPGINIISEIVSSPLHCVRTSISLPNVSTTKRCVKFGPALTDRLLYAWRFRLLLCYNAKVALRCSDMFSNHALSVLFLIVYSERQYPLNNSHSLNIL